MNLATLFLALAVTALTWVFPGPVAAAAKPRVVVSTDIGGSDPDDFQSMVHYLVYADGFDTEGLISSPPGKGRATAIGACIAAYELDFPTLRTWSTAYPAPGALRQVVRQGAIHRQAGPVPSPVISEGAKLIVERALVEDPRPLYVLVWGTLTDVAQAVHHHPGIKAKLRIYSIGSWNTQQDRRARDYLFGQHPDLWWIENDTTYRGMYLGGFQHGDFGGRRFAAKHVKGHGHLGAFFMGKKADIKMGDTPSVLYLLQGDAGRPETAHWGGAFVRPYPAQRPTYWHDRPERALADRGWNGAKTVSQWRRAYLTDWQGRMDRLLTKAGTDFSSTPEKRP